MEATEQSWTVTEQSRAVTEQSWTGTEKRRARKGHGGRGRMVATEHSQRAELDSDREEQSRNRAKLDRGRAEHSREGAR